MARIALGIEYCGTDFEGWQTQPHGRTVQDVLQAAVRRIADAPVEVVCAGRTDTGVHAAVQVVHVDVAAVRPVSAWVRGVNANLPESVAVTWAREVEANFHARFSAQTRTYRYLLLNRPVRPALLNRRIGWFHAPLDVEEMARSARLLLGEQDFSAFRAAGCQAKSPIRTMLRASVCRHHDWIVFEFEANAFLHHMIRNLVGALIYIGRGSGSAATMGALLAKRDRTASPPTFAPDGLYLCGVTYPPGWNLPGDGRIIAPLFLPAFPD